MKKNDMQDLDEMVEKYTCTKCGREFYWFNPFQEHLLECQLGEEA